MSCVNCRRLSIEIERPDANESGRSWRLTTGGLDGWPVIEDFAPVNAAADMAQCLGVSAVLGHLIESRGPAAVTDPPCPGQRVFH